MSCSCHAPQGPFDLDCELGLPGGITVPAPCFLPGTKPKGATSPLPLPLPPQAPSDPVSGLMVAAIAVVAFLVLRK
jgi:hypothetical protein